MQYAQLSSAARETAPFLQEAAHIQSTVCLQASQLKHGVSIVADLTKEDDMNRAIKEAIEKLGGLDILVNKWVPSHIAHRLLGQIRLKNMGSFLLHSCNHSDRIMELLNQCLPSYWWDAHADADQAF